MNGTLSGGRCLVTGGAGFIGHHLTQRLLADGCKSIVMDAKGGENLLKMEGSKLSRLIKECDTVFHLAAHPDVRLADPRAYEGDVLATLQLLEAARGGDTTLAYTSSSTVYGNASSLPTPESYPLVPISLYGASKMACEGLISAYCHTYGLNSVIYRLANIVGPGCHGVIPEFYQRLRRNPHVLEVLGDGTQLKSYCYVSDCVEALLVGLGSGGIYNVGSEDAISVKKVADIISEEMGVSPSYRFKGDKGEGWPGDVRRSWMSIDKLKGLGWTPKHDSEGAVRQTVRALMDKD